MRQNSFTHPSVEDQEAIPMTSVDSMFPPRCIFRQTITTLPFREARLHHRVVGLTEGIVAYCTIKKKKFFISSNNSLQKKKKKIAPWSFVHVYQERAQCFFLKRWRLECSHRSLQGMMSS
jgi:hypothetical protein